MCLDRSSSGGGDKCIADFCNLWWCLFDFGVVFKQKVFEKAIDQGRH